MGTMRSRRPLPIGGPGANPCPLRQPQAPNLGRAKPPSTMASAMARYRCVSRPVMNVATCAGPGSRPTGGPGARVGLGELRGPM